MNTNMRKVSAILATTLFLMPAGFTASADETPEIVVTGARIAQTVDESLSPVTVVTREEIEEKHPQEIQALVRAVPGISLVNNGGIGKVTSISLRGSETNHVLVLVDGVRVGSATTGSVQIQHIPVQQIDRIEVVRGPRSHLYGSSAIGGVVQIFTKRGSKELQTSGSMGYGSNNTFEADTGLTGSTNGTQFAVNVGLRRSDGINACGDGVNNASGGCFANEPDEDGYRQKSFNGRVSHEFDNGLNLELQAQAANNSLEFDGNSQNQSKDKQRLLGLTGTKDISETWGVKVSAARSWDLTKNYKNSAFSSRFNTMRDNASWQNDIRLNETDLLIVGLDYLNDKVDSTTAYAVNERYNHGAFGQYIAEFGKHSVQVSLRSDKNEQFGKNYTGSAAWGYALPHDFELLASYGIAFNAPTFNELFFPNFGSADNKPEKSRSFEVGLRSTGEFGNWAVYGFQTDVEDLIAFDSDTSLANNIDSARMRGVEVEGGTTWQAWDIDTTATWLNARNRAKGSNRGNHLIRRPTWSGNLNVSRDIEAYRVSSTVHHAGVAFDNASNARKLDKYTTVDLRVSRAVKKDWRVEVSANNLFDENYQTASFFNQDGRNFFLRLRYAPQAD